MYQPTEFGIPMTDNLEREVEKMCNLSQGVYDKGYDKGYIKGYDLALAEAVRNLMESTGWDIEKCMDSLKIPDDKKMIYKAAVLGVSVSA